VQADAYTGTHVELAPCVRLSVSILNSIVKNHEEIERSCIQLGPFSEQWISLECLPLEKLESAITAGFKKAYESNASTDGTHIKEKVLYISRLRITNFLASNGLIDRFRKWHILYRTLSRESRSVGPETV
jgi:hypothetical protein